MRLTESELLCELHDLARTPGVERISVMWETADNAINDFGERIAGGCCLSPSAMPMVLSCPCDVTRVNIAAEGSIPASAGGVNSIANSLNEARHRLGLNDLENVHVTPHDSGDGQLHFAVEKVLQ